MVILVVLGERVGVVGCSKAVLRERLRSAFEDMVLSVL